MTTAREKIFRDIRAALETLPERTARPEVPREAADARWLEGDTLDLFAARAKSAGTQCFGDAGTLAAWLAQNGAKKVYIPADMDDLSRALSGNLEVVREYRRDLVDEIGAAITPAFGAIAESGSVILTDATTPDRLAALAPWIHVAVVRKDTVRRSIADALASMPEDPNIIWVTGPSKTADVEGILIQGVHGPGLQACLLV